jgi:hypothetical protein
MLSGLGIEPVIQYRIRGIQRGRGFDRGIADVQFSGVPDAQFASYL